MQQGAGELIHVRRRQGGAPSPTHGAHCRPCRVAGSASMRRTRRLSCPTSQVAGCGKRRSGTTAGGASKRQRRHRTAPPRPSPLKSPNGVVLVLPCLRVATPWRTHRRDLPMGLGVCAQGRLARYVRGPTPSCCASASMGSRRNVKPGWCWPDLVRTPCLGALWGEKQLCLVDIPSAAHVWSCP